MGLKSIPIHVSNALPSSLTPLSFQRAYSIEATVGVSLADTTDVMPFSSAFPPPPDRRTGSLRCWLLEAHICTLATPIVRRKKREKLFDAKRWLCTPPSCSVFFFASPVLVDLLRVGVNARRPRSWGPPLGENSVKTHTGTRYQARLCIFFFLFSRGLHKNSAA